MLSLFDYTDEELDQLKFVRAHQRAAKALLLEKFHLSIREYDYLTDREIDELYFHPRDENGGIKLPTGPGADEPSYARDLADLRAVSAVLPLKPGALDKLHADLKKKWGLV